MLLRQQRLQRQLLPRFERRELVLQLLVFFVLAVLGLFINFQEAVELHHRSGNAEPENVAAGFRVDVDRGLVEHSRIHLRGDKALPDQLVNLEFVFLQILLDLVRMPRRRSRTNGFVRRLALLSSPYMYWAIPADTGRHIRCAMYSRTSVIASGATRVESVRM